MSVPAISIIVPVYNVETYLPACLESIRQQTFHDFELILVNDCTPDNSQVIIDKFIKDNSDIIIQVVSHTVNRGLSAARNSGINVARGKYLYFLDSDDSITKDCLQTLHEASIDSTPDIIVGENRLISPKGTRTIKLETDRAITGTEVINTFCKRLWHNQVWNKLYRRDLIESHHLRFAEGTILEDELWSFEIACNARNVAFVHHVTYNYYIRPKSIISTLKDSSERWYIFLNINQQIHELVRHHSLQGNPYVGRYILDNLLTICHNLSKNGALTPSILDRIVQLNVMPLHRLWQHGLISLKQLIAYSYFYLRAPYSLTWYKILAHL